jgi:hypothetical protein
VKDVKFIVQEEQERQNKSMNIIIKGVKEWGEKEDTPEVVRAFLQEMIGWARPI